MNDMLRRIWEFISCRKCWTGVHANAPIHTVTRYETNRWI